MLHNVQNYKMKHMNVCSDGKTTKAQAIASKMLFFIFCEKLQMQNQA